MKTPPPVKRQVEFVVGKCPSCQGDISGEATVTVDIGIGPVNYIHKDLGTATVKVTGDPEISHVSVRHDCVKVAEDGDAS